MNYLLQIYPQRYGPNGPSDKFEITIRTSALKLCVVWLIICTRLCISSGGVKSQTDRQTDRHPYSIINKD